MRLFSVFFILAWLLAPAAWAEDQPQLTYTIAAVNSGAEIKLDNGEVLRLAGIEQPFKQTSDWRDKAKQVLQALTTGGKLVLENISTDRYGSKTAQAYILGTNNNKIWLQGEMLKQGLAFVYPPTGSETHLDEMRTLEAAARQTRIGIWADEAYADTPADRMNSKEGQFAFASGTVLDAKRVKSIVYIHFGENWRYSLTIAIAAHDLRAFREANLDPLDLQGKTIRARGWVKHDIGPMIAITDPGQMEIESK